MKPATLMLDRAMEVRCDRQHRMYMENIGYEWTPYDSLAQVMVDHSPAPAEIAQAGFAARMLEKQEDLKVFLVRNRCRTRYDNGESDTHRTSSIALLLFEPWQWASFHTALYSICAPFMNGAPG